MTQFLSACQMGLIYALLAMGVFMTFRVLNTPDLTVDGSFTLGMVVCCVVSDKADPALAILAAGACGMLACNAACEQEALRVIGEAMK